MATLDTLMKQGTQTASFYMDAACESIDFKFGKGFAKAHPELLAAFIRNATRRPSLIGYYHHIRQSLRPQSG